MITTTRIITLSLVLIVVGSLTALEIHKPKDLDYAVEIYERNSSGHNELVGAAIGFRDKVPGVPFYRKTNITLKSPVNNAILITVDKETDEMVQKFTFKEPLRNNAIIELSNCKENADKKNICSLRHEVISPTKHSIHQEDPIKELDKLIEELESMRHQKTTPISRSVSSESIATSPSPEAASYATPTSTSASPYTTPDLK